MTRTDGNIYNEDDLDTVSCFQNKRMFSQILSTRYTHFGYFFVTQDAAGSKFLQIHFLGRSYGSEFYGSRSIFFATRPFMVNNLFLSCVVTTNTASFLPVPHLAPLMGVARAKQQHQLTENCLEAMPNNKIILSLSNWSFCRVTVEDLSIVLKEIVGSLGGSPVGEE